MKIAGMVTLYNPDELISENICSYLDDIHKLYVIDNSDNSNKMLLPQNSKIIYMPNYKNVGIASALNIAAKAAIADGYNWLLTMDQDSKFNKKDVEKLCEYI